MTGAGTGSGSVLTVAGISGDVVSAGTSIVTVSPFKGFASPSLDVCDSMGAGSDA